MRRLYYVLKHQEKEVQRADFAARADTKKSAPLETLELTPSRVRIKKKSQYLGTPTTVALSRAVPFG